MPAAKSCSLEGATGRNLQQAATIFSLHSPTSRPPFHCLPAASLHPFLPYRFSVLFSISLFYFHVEQLPAVKASAASPARQAHTPMRTHRTQLERTHTNTSVHKMTDEERGAHRQEEEAMTLFFLWITQAIIVFWANIRAIKQRLLSSCSLWYIWRSNVYIFFIVQWHNLTLGQIFDYLETDDQVIEEVRPFFLRHYLCTTVYFYISLDWMKPQVRSLNDSTFNAWKEKFTYI